MSGIIGEFDGILIRLCRCGAEPKVFEEGFARRSLDDDDEGIYFAEPPTYTVECSECGCVMCLGKTPYEVIEAWNDMVDD